MDMSKNLKDAIGIYSVDKCQFGSVDIDIIYDEIFQTGEGKIIINSNRQLGCAIRAAEAVGDKPLFDALNKVKTTLDDSGFTLG
jgi:hypothetical protein